MQVSTAHCKPLNSTSALIFSLLFYSAQNIHGTYLTSANFLILTIVCKTYLASLWIYKLYDIYRMSSRPYICAGLPCRCLYVYRQVTRLTRQCVGELASCWPRPVCMLCCPLGVLCHHDADVLFSNYPIILSCSSLEPPLTNRHVSLCIWQVCSPHCAAVLSRK